jgi:hypothetical protein
MVDKENFFRLALYGPGYALAMAAPQYQSQVNFLGSEVFKSASAN